MLDIAVLAGGLGTRLGHLTQRLPKALVDVNGRPFVDYQLDLLHEHGFRRVVFCVSYLGEMIEAHVGDGSRFGLEVAYVYDGPERMGTAGALKSALPHLGERFAVIYGDSYLRCDYAAAQQTFEGSGKSGLMSVYRNANALAPSNVLYVDGNIRRYDKANPLPEMQHIDYGLSFFERHAFDAIDESGVTDLVEVFGSLLVRSDLAAHEFAERFYEVGTPEGIAEFSKMLHTRRRE